MSRWFNLVAVAAILAVPATPANFRVDSTVVLVNVTVTDARGRFVTGLQRSDFQVFEDHTAQPITYFSAEEAPVSVGLILDFSKSMTPVFVNLKQAVTEFLKSANTGDEFSLIEFRDQAELTMGFSAATEEIVERVSAARPDGDTALLDAVYLGLDQMRRARNSRKILLIVSDGGDNHSRYKAREVKALAREADVEIYAIGLVGPSTGRTGYELVEGPSLLNELAEEGAGRYYEAWSPRELPALAEKIGRELRHQYVLGYMPTNPAPDGRYRHIQVKAPRAPGQPRLSVYWKRGYYARQPASSPARRVRTNGP